MIYEKVIKFKNNLSKKNRSTDLILCIVLIVIVIYVFRNILTPGFESYRDFVVPASWMNISNFKYDNFQYYNTLNTTNVLNLYWYLNAILIAIFGSYGFHISAIIPEIIIPISAYFFSRKLKISRFYSVLISLFSIFNPYTFTFNFDTPINLYYVMFYFVFFISYFIFRTEKKLIYFFIALLTFLSTSVFGADLFIFFGTLIIIEISLLLADIKRIKRWIRDLPIPILFGLSYIVFHIHDLIISSGDTIQFGATTSSTIEPKYNLIQIITFQADYSYENTLNLLFSNWIYLFIIILFIILFVTLLVMFFYKFINTFKRGDYKADTLYIFTMILLVYSIIFDSRGTNYLYFNSIIIKFFPFISIIDPWDDGALYLFSLMFLLVSINLKTDVKSRNILANLSKHYICASKSSRFLVRLKFSKNRQNIISTFLIVVLLLFSSIIPFSILSNQLDNEYSPNVIPNDIKQTYLAIDNNSNGYYFVIPPTRDVSFNYSNYVLNGIGKDACSIADASFWGVFTNNNLYQGPLSSNLVQSLNGQNLSCQNTFQAISDLVGIKYIVNINPHLVRQWWPYQDYPIKISNDYILNYTKFKLLESDSNISIFYNPYFHGISFYSKQFIVSNNLIVREMRLWADNISIPLINYTEYKEISSLRPNIRFYTLNSTISNNSGGSIFLISLSNLNVYRNLTESNPKFNEVPLSSLSETNKFNSIVSGENMSSIHTNIQGNLSIFTKDSKFNYINQTASVIQFENAINYTTQDFIYHNMSQLSFYFHGNPNGFIALYSGDLYIKMVPYWGGQIIIQNLKQTNRTRNYILYYNPSLFTNGSYLSLFFLNDYVTLSLDKHIFISLRVKIENNSILTVVKQNATIKNLNYNGLIRINNTNRSNIIKSQSYLIFFNKQIKNNINPYIMFGINKSLSDEFSNPAFTYVRSIIYSNQEIYLNSTNSLTKGIIVINIPADLPYKLFNSNGVKFIKLNSYALLILNTDRFVITIKPYSFGFYLDSIYTYGLFILFLIIVTLFSYTYFKRRMSKCNQNYNE